MGKPAKLKAGLGCASTDMKCPECKAEVIVLESRERAPAKRGAAQASTYRRYECFNMHRFTTYEYCVADTSKHALNNLNVKLSNKALLSLLSERLK